MDGETADLIITYVTHSFGGAYKAYSYAKKEGKENHQSLRTIKTGPLGIPSTEEGVKSVLFFSFLYGLKSLFYYIFFSFYNR